MLGASTTSMQHGKTMCQFYVIDAAQGLTGTLLEHHRALKKPLTTQLYNYFAFNPNGPPHHKNSSNTLQKEAAEHVVDQDERKGTMAMHQRLPVFCMLSLQLCSLVSQTRSADKCCKQLQFKMRDREKPDCGTQGGVGLKGSEGKGLLHLL